MGTWEERSWGDFPFKEGSMTRIGIKTKKGQ